MKKILLITGLLICSLNYAQNDHKGLIGFSIGTSMPTGDFASKDHSNMKGKYADLGINYNIDGAYFFHENFGISANLFSKSWGLDFIYEYDEWFYSSSGILLGGIATIPKGNFNFDFKLQLGYAKSKREVMSGGLHIFHDMIVPKLTGEAFAYSTGLGIRLHLGKRIDTMLNYTYFNTKPTLENNGSYSIDYDITSNNFTLGVGYRL